MNIKINNSYSKYGIFDGVINIIMIIMLFLILNNYKFNIVLTSYLIFTIISILLHLKMKNLRFYKSKDKINVFFTFSSIFYFKFSQIIIIVLMSLYLYNDSNFRNNVFTILFIININTFINLAQTIILLKRSYITKDKKLYLNHRKIIDFRDIKNIKKNLSKLGGNSIYVILKNNKKIKTEVTKNDYEFLKTYI